MFIRTLLRTIKLLYRVARVKKNESEEEIEKLKKITLKSGPIAIKFIQFMASNEELFSSNISSKLSDVFENCTIHEMAQTEHMYKEDFGRDIYDDYIFDNSVHSGSIGQVYRATSKSTGKSVAIKVKHPLIDKNVKEFIQCLTFSIDVLKFFFKVPYLYLAIEFIQNIQMQLDFVKEANNMRRLKKDFVGIDCIIVPEVITASPRFIIMSFHEGKNINEIKDKSLKLRVSLYLNLFVLTSILIHNFLHCDLHCGNWKVDVSEKDPKLIIYDCGIFAETNNISKNKKVIGCLLDANFIELIDVIKSEDSEDIDKLKIKIQPIQNDRHTNASVKLNKFLTFLLESQVKVDNSIVRIIQGLAITGKNVTHSVDTLTSTFANYRNGDKTLLLFAYLCITFNSKHFVKLHEFYKVWIDEKKEQTDIFLEWLKTRYGHQDVDIFYESLCDIFELKYVSLNYPDVYLA